MCVNMLNRGLYKGAWRKFFSPTPDLTTMEKKELLEVADGLGLSGLKSKTNRQIIEAIKEARDE